MVTKLKTGTKVGQLGIWDGTQWVAGDPDCNIVKWGGTALTARDITTLLDHLNVDLSTKARLQPWYQTNFTTTSIQYDGGAIAPHASTVRATYTVPASRIAVITGSSAMFNRVVAATVADRTLIRAEATIPAAYILFVQSWNIAVDTYRQSAVGQGMILKASDAIRIVTGDGCTGGSCDYKSSIALMVFDT